MIKYGLATYTAKELMACLAVVPPDYLVEIDSGDVVTTETFMIDVDHEFRVVRLRGEP